MLFYRARGKQWFSKKKEEVGERQWMASLTMVTVWGNLLAFSTEHVRITQGLGQQTAGLTPEKSETVKSLN